MEREAEKGRCRRVRARSPSVEPSTSAKRPQTSQAPFSVQSRREDKAEPEREAA